jgi:LPXTG-site transpeptidase (sortase) family protein
MCPTGCRAVAPHHRPWICGPSSGPGRALCPQCVYNVIILPYSSLYGRCILERIIRYLWLPVLILVAVGLVSAWVGNSWRPSPAQIQAEAKSTLSVLEVVTLAAGPSTPQPAPAMSTLNPTPTLFVISGRATTEPTLAITPTPRPTVDYGREGATGRIEIPAIGVDQMIVPVSWRIKIVNGQAVSQFDTVDGAVAHNRGSAPLGGSGNTVLTGHTRGNGKGEFQNLWELQPGQEVHVWDAVGDEYAYVVESVQTLQEVGLTVEQRKANAQLLLPTDDDRLTLITCWPEWVYTHRVIVIARPSDTARP